MLSELVRHTEKFYYFYEVANEGSLQATSRKLGISAPSLSHSIKQLESVIGTPLFNRSKSGVTVSIAGDKLLVFCRRYFREIEEVQRLMIHPQEEALRKIKVGTFQSIALYFWPLLIDSLTEKSKISLSITTNRSKAIHESLIKREIDIALTVEDLKHEKLIKHELYKDDYAFYCSALWEKNVFKKSDLRELAILYIPDAVDETGKSLMQFVNSWNLLFRDEIELDSLEVISEFVTKGYGIGILPTKVAKSHSKNLKQIRIEGVPNVKFGTHRFFLSYRDDLDIPQSLMRLFLETARKAVLKLNSGTGT
jgi:LysR family transcriptional regulator, cell division regulator